MPNRSSVWMLVFALGFGAGCHSARYVSKGKDEGVIAIPADNEGNRKKAEALMAAHFPEGYQIVFEHEHKTGETERRVTDSRFRTTGPVQPVAGYETPSYRQGNRRSQTTIQIVDKNEWWIRYRRKGAEVRSPEGGTSIADILPEVTVR